jgi:DNA-directed RNA polymerase subunit M/transcription elongation factor TFIIS
MEEFRSKGKNTLKKIFTKEQNVIIFEKNIYENTLKNLKKYENLEDIYIFNIYQFVNDYNSNDSKNVQELLKEIKNGKIHWKNNYFNDLIDKEIEQDNFLIKPIEIEEGVLECKCGSKRVFSYQKQCRGGDESSTTFAECVACKSKWIYSG